MEKYSELFTEEGNTAGNMAQYAIAAKALHGPLERVNENVYQVGQDAILSMPEYGIFGVFDGAGGATDVGDPAIASRTAATAARSHFVSNIDNLLGHESDYHFSNEDHLIRGAMNHVREMVKGNPEAGLTTTAMVRIIHIGKKIVQIAYANAGDSSLLLYPDFTDRPAGGHATTRLIAGDQQSDRYLNSPSNIVGRVPFDLRHIESQGHDQIGFMNIDRGETDTYLLLGTDGVMGHWKRATEINEAHLEYGLDIEPQLRSALDNPTISQSLRRLAYRWGFDIGNMDWEEYHTYIEQKLSNRRDKKITPPTIEQVASSLVQPRITHEFERKRNYDDKSLVCVRIPVDE